MKTEYKFQNLRNVIKIDIKLVKKCIDSFDESLDNGG